MPLPDDILAQLEDLKDRVENLEKYPQPPNVVESNESSVSFVIGGSGSGSSQILIATILHNVYNLKLLAVPRMTLFLDRSGEGGGFYRYPFKSSAGWTEHQIDNLHIEQWLAPFDDDQNHPDDLVCYTLLKNTLTVAYPLHVIFDWRIMSMEGG